MLVEKVQNQEIALKEELIATFFYWKILIMNRTNEDLIQFSLFV